MRKCAVDRCEKKVSSERYLMCWRHWSRVPRHLQDAVWREYFYGVRRKTHPTREYLAAVSAAKEAVK